MKTAEVQEPSEGLDEKLKQEECSSGVTTGRVGITSGSLVINQGSTQVNSTGVYWAMYWTIYTVQGRAWTKLCYCYCPMAKEELGQGLPAMNGKRCAYQGHKVEMKRREARHSH